MAQSEEPYSHRDPYWGVDDYGRPLSYGRPTLFGPPEPEDSSQLAEQATYLQADPSHRPVDPAAFRAPSVFRPTWPVSVHPAPAQRAPIHDEQLTVWMSGTTEQATERVATADDEQQTMRTTPPNPVPPRPAATYPGTGPTPEYPPARSVVADPPWSPGEFVWGAAGHSFNGGAAPAEPPPRRRRGRLVLALLIVGTLAAGTLLVTRHLNVTAGGRSQSGPTGALSTAWTAPRNRLTLDSVVQGGRLITVECDSSTPPGVTGRVREDSRSCALVGRKLTDGREEWHLDRQPIGASLTAVGPSVIAYGGQQALIVSAESGDILRTFARGELLGFAGNTAVMAERTDAGAARAVAVDVGDGHDLWQTPIAANLTDEDTRLSRIRTQAPDGLADNPLPATSSDGQYVMLPDPQRTGRYQIRRISSGETVTAGRTDETLVGIAGDNALFTGAGGGILSARKLGATDPTLAWTYRLPAKAEVSSCSGLVCVRAADDRRGVLLAPADGRILVDNDAGPIYVSAAGEAVAVARCRFASADNICPAGSSTLDVVSLGDGRVLMHAEAPSFVSILGADQGTRIIFGTAYGKGTQLVEFDTATSRRRDLGTAPIKPFDSVTLPTRSLDADGNIRFAVPNLSCVSGTTSLTCGSRWASMRLTTWNIAEQG
ncbi:MAG TPA: hypothetical protein VHU91_04910 [Mycobacteriales bacterium]|nr:hypothetical protein [Mycobacteriales bacterium]